MAALQIQYIPMVVVLLWLFLIAISSLLSGWFPLMRRFPNQNEQPILTLHGQSGRLNYVRMSRIVTLSTCPHGLRVGMNRIFGPACREFFVAWQDIVITRRYGFFSGQRAELTFGNPAVGRLIIEGRVANELARSAFDSWPESSSFAEETRRGIMRDTVMKWFLDSVLGSSLVMIVIAAIGPLHHLGLSSLFIISGLTVIYGLRAVVEYLTRSARLSKWHKRVS